MNVHIDAPYITCKEYAKRCGLSERAVREKCMNGKLPTAPRDKDGEHYLVNVAALLKQALEAQY